jgi:hypothetical protein
MLHFSAFQDARAFYEHALKIQLPYIFYSIMMFGLHFYPTRAKIGLPQNLRSYQTFTE